MIFATSRESTIVSKQEVLKQQTDYGQHCIELGSYAKYHANKYFTLII